MLEGLDQIGGHLEGQPRLARTSRAGDGDQMVVPEETLDLLDLGLSPDEAGELEGKVVPEGVERPEPREIAGKIGVVKLIHALQLGQVSETVLPDVLHAHSGRKVSADERLGCGGHDDLATIRDRPKPGASIDVLAQVVAGRFAGVDRHPNLHRRALRPRLSVQGKLKRGCGRDRVAGPLEHGEEAVALASFGQDMAIVRGDALVQQGARDGRGPPASPRGLPPISGSTLRCRSGGR
jgi:hypothetical protein